ncbi:hypothetical protein [Schleiferilactobacillus perolens]|uniref:hypothetical protein n=1 Tax=Schleiferilactobacillus perolens TaxID=100468 RepID=UPI0012EDE0DF|nr:hypothetical protein [Schleiferilactobacillus perolens]
MQWTKIAERCYRLVGEGRKKGMKTKYCHASLQEIYKAQVKLLHDASIINMRLIGELRNAQ